MVDPNRLKRVVGRYIRGLHFATFNLRVDTSWDVHVLVHPEQLNVEQEKFYRIFQGGTLRVIQEGVFWYVHARPVDHPTASAWLLIFFDNFPVFGFVRPPV